MTPGKVIVLNGTTSSGKTTLATTLQAQLASAGECWIIIALDDFFAKLLELVEARERDRGDRVIGMARAQYDIVHKYATYDLAVDTATMDPSAAADAILASQ